MFLVFSSETANARTYNLDIILTDVVSNGLLHSWDFGYNCDYTSDCDLAVYFCIKETYKQRCNSYSRTVLTENQNNWQGNISLTFTNLNIWSHTILQYQAEDQDLFIHSKIYTNYIMLSTVKNQLNKWFSVRQPAIVFYVKLY